MRGEHLLCHQFSLKLTAVNHTAITSKAIELIPSTSGRIGVILFLLPEIKGRRRTDVAEF
jgi:hypothetical protein